MKSTVFARFFIDQPVIAMVLSIIMTLAGGLALWTLTVAQYPDIAPPTVEVSAAFPGANAQVVADTVCQVRPRQDDRVDSAISRRNRLRHRLRHDATY
jgi:multidrug efflux pump